MTVFFLSLILFSSGTAAWAKDFPPRWIELELEAVEGATGYELEFKSAKSGKVALFKTETFEWKAKVRPGKYDMRLRSYDSRGVPGEWSESTPVTINFPGPKLLTPKFEEKIATEKTEDAKVTFTWENLEGLPFYKIEVKSGDKVWTEVVEKNEHSFDLPVGRSFDWTVYALQGKDEAGEASEVPGKFVVLGKKLAKPAIKDPLDRYVSEVIWDPVQFAENYSYIISRKENGKWKAFIKKAKHNDTKVMLPTDMKGGDMRLQVRAEGLHRPTSDISIIEFPVFEGRRDPASIDENRLRDSIEKPTNWYAIASYYIAQMTIQGREVLAGGANRVSLSPLGGTGRVGAGYFNPKSNWGFIGLADLSGFTLDGGKTATYPSIEMHGAWRKYFGTNQLRASGGLYQRDFVEVFQPQPGVNNFDFRKYSVMGVHAGVDFWRPLNFKYGLQINARMYLPASANTPGDHEMTPSYHMGFMGSYRLAPEIMGFAGYAYRVDTLKFMGALANQEVQYSGHYVNLLIEWGF